MIILKKQNVVKGRCLGHCPKCIKGTLVIAMKDGRPYAKCTRPECPYSVSIEIDPPKQESLFE